MTPAPSLQELIDLVETETEDTSPLGRLRTASVLAGHLAQLGDAALGYFVDQARHAGHSWSQIGDALGVTKQAAQQKHTVRQPPGFDEAAVERFTPRARNAIKDARRIAREWGHDYVGTEHLLLSLYRDPRGLAAQVLVESELSEERAVAAVKERVRRGESAHTEARPFTPRANAVIEDARAAAWDLGHDYVGTEHLLIALDRAEGVAGEVLTGAGLTPDLVRERVVAKLSPDDGA
jgi:hypothetical protein